MSWKSFSLVILPSIVPFFIGGTLMLLAESPTSELPSSRQGETVQEKVSKALAGRLEVDYKQLPLNRVAEDLQAKLSVPVRLDDKALSDVGIKLNTPITFKSSKISARAAIGFMLYQLRLKLMVTRDGFLLISTPEYADSIEITKVYKVNDLVYHGVPAGMDQPDFDNLTDMITSCVHPGTWPPSGTGSGPIRCLDIYGLSAIAVVQTEEIHLEVEQLLSDLRTVRHETMKDNDGHRTLPVPIATPVPPAVKAVRRALDKPVTLKYDAVPLDAVARNLEDMLNIPVRIDRWGLEDTGIKCNAPVTFSVSDVQARTAIALMLHKLELSTTIRFESLIITTPVEAEYTMTTRVYDVADLLLRNLKSNKHYEFDQMLDMVRSCIMPGSWGETGGSGTIAPYEADGIAAIVAYQPNYVHDEIEKLLSQMRAIRRTSELKPQERIKPIPPPISKAEKTLREALARPISLQFKDATLVTVVDSLKKKIGLQIILYAKSKGSQKTLTLQLHDIPLESALNWICHFCLVDWTCYDGYLVITETDNEDFWRFTRCYDVSDLLYYRDEQGKGVVDYDNLIDFFSDFVAPTSWDNVGGPCAIAHYEAKGIQSLVVHQTWQNHRKIEKLLAEVRRLRGPAPTGEDIEKLPLPPKPPQLDPKTKPAVKGKGMF